MPSKTLYICYFGLQEPLVQTQVIPYLREIRKDEIGVSLLTFEPNLRRNWPKKRIEEQRAELSRLGIDWHCLAYHKWPSAPATAYDIFRGSFFVWRLLARERFDILHGRVHIPTLIGALARRFSRTKPKLLFDVRGFFPEEYTDAGIWPKDGLLYRSAKRIEKWLLRESDGFVLLTEKGRDILFPGSAESGLDVEGRPVEVIPCCVDLERFSGSHTTIRHETRQKLKVDGRLVLVYVGSFGGWYLTDEMFDFFEIAKKVDPKLFVMILTQRDVGLATEKIRQSGFREEDFMVRTVSPEEIPTYLNAADVAVSFIKNCYSKQASSPTKNAEYLAAGLPIVANSGVGDVDDLIMGDRVGALLDTFEPNDQIAAIETIAALGDVADRCRETAKLRFDLESVGGIRYRRLYQTLLQSK